MYLYNFPVYKPVEFYTAVIEKIVGHLSTTNGIISIYQIGGINDPGISDLDIVAVFEDGAVDRSNPLVVLNKEEGYLFTHTVFGISRSFLPNLSEFSLFNCFTYLWGEKIFENTVNEKSESAELKVQTGLEYLLNNVIARTIESYYRLLSIRNILLSAKAIEYDLLLLNHSDNSGLQNRVDELKEIRRTWFCSEFDRNVFLSWYSKFNNALFNFTSDAFKTQPLYLPGHKSYKLGRNVTISPGSKFTYRKFGFSLPPSITSISRKIRNANGLFNRFEFRVPTASQERSFLKNRCMYYKKMIKYNKKHLLYYLTLSNGIISKVCS
ncbi:MAG: hypothetical protein Q7S39_05660 [Ignavibacteria bacterium]|nr:hypothetical protein [Ignavibacteria bacterium]